VVAAGKTSNDGLNHPVRGVSGSTAPATFARLVAKADPHLVLQPWATKNRRWLGLAGLAATATRVAAARTKR
jgi:hypothetical protein